MYSPNPSNLFYLFNFDSIFSMLHLPIEEKVKTAVQVPITNDISEHLILFNKNLNVLTQKVDLLLEKYTLNNQMIETLLQQNQAMHNNSAEKLAIVVQNTANLKSGIFAIHSSLDAGFKNTILAFNNQTSAYNAQSKEVLLNLSNLNEISPKILQTLNVSRDLQIQSIFTQKEILSALSAQSDLINEIGNSTLNALDAKSNNINELNQKYEILKQTQESNHQQAVENAKALQSELRKEQNEISGIKSDVNALKPKQYETKVSWYSNIPFVSDYFSTDSNKK
jgi:hypothetical protein